ncbi:MAG: SdpI family protein, partial [Gemmatimonadetes bacterium]|nr:SdpI family protein [Gemmatimonadota bacterium]
MSPIRRWPGPAVLAAMWGFALAVFRRLPAEVPTHWNLHGVADGWMPRFPGAFALPAVATAVWLLTAFQSRFDPYRGEVERSTPTRVLITEIVVVFMAALEGVTVGIAMGWPIEMSRVMWPATGLLLVAIGNFLPRVRRNWFIGVRTPWTLSSEAVWRTTHRVAGWTLVGAGLAVAAAGFLPEGARPWVALGALAVAAVVPVG